ncbi:hypothetical protein L7F22_007620 [Adiantum nelumboides]|nr:hypothetical protein [Adiantum nelumboides]
MARGHLYALDFDGVLCDSCGESSISALNDAKVRWPEVFADIDEPTKSWILETMHMVRPVVETGYENLLLVRLLLESKVPAARKTSVAEGLSVDKILEHWTSIKPEVMKDWGEMNRDALIEVFGKVRDDWISHDLQGWICANRLYPGVPDALKFARSKIYIVTTKQVMDFFTLMDVYKEEGRSSQDRHPIPIAHEVGEGSCYAEETFRMQLVNDVTLLKHLMDNPRFMELLRSPLMAQQVQDAAQQVQEHPPLSEHVEAKF